MTTGSPVARRTRPVTIPVGMKVTPEVDYKTQDTSQYDAANFWKTTLRFFSRDAAGHETESYAYTGVFSSGGTSRFLHADASYCGSLTVESLFDPALHEVTEVCVQNAIDVSVSTEENEKHVRDSLKGCPGAVFPAGYSAEQPAAAGGPPDAPVLPAAEAGGSGCAIGGQRDPIMGTSWWLAGLALVEVARRMRRTRTPIGR